MVVKCLDGGHKSTIELHIGGARSPKAKGHDYIRLTTLDTLVDDIDGKLWEKGEAWGVMETAEDLKRDVRRVREPSPELSEFRSLSKVAYYLKRIKLDDDIEGMTNRAIDKLLIALKVNLERF